MKKGAERRKRSLFENDPTPGEAARYCRGAGIASIVTGAIWAVFVGALAWHLGPKKGTRLPDFFWWFMPFFILQVVGGAMMLAVSYGINKRAAWTRPLVRISSFMGFVIAVWGIMGFYLLLLMPRLPWGTTMAAVIAVVFALFFIFMIVQSFRHSLKFLRWFDRLDYSGADIEQIASAPARPVPEAETYIHNWIKLGPDRIKLITTFLFMALWIMSILLHHFILFAIIIMAAILALTFLPKALYRRPTPFERQREVVESFSGTGARLLVYADGIEVREYFRAIFIPYDWLDDLPDKMTWRDSAISLQTALPGVPRDLKFHANKMERVLETIRTQRERYLDETGRLSP